jgi:hypothetical protein
MKFLLVTSMGDVPDMPPAGNNDWLSAPMGNGFGDDRKRISSIFTIA